MAIGLTPRASLFSTANATTYTATSFTPSPGSLLVAFVSVSGPTQVDPTTLPTGHGGFWTPVNLSAQNLGTTHRLGVYVALAPAVPTSAGFTISGYASNRTGAAIIVYEITGSDVSFGTGTAIVQGQTANGTGTTGTVTLSAAANSANRAIAFFVHLANESTTPRVNWTEGAVTPPFSTDGTYNSPSTGAEAQYRGDAFETTASATWATNAAWRGIALEVRSSTLIGAASTSWTAVAALTAAITLGGAVPVAFGATGTLAIGSGTAAALAGAVSVGVTTTSALTTAVALSTAPPGTVRVQFGASAALAGTTAVQARAVVSPQATQGRAWRSTRRWGPPPESDTRDAAALAAQPVIRITVSANLSASSGRVVVSSRQSAGATVIWGPPPGAFVLPTGPLAATPAVAVTATGALTTAIRQVGSSSLTVSTTAALTTSVAVGGSVIEGRVVVSPRQSAGRRMRQPKRWGPVAYAITINASSAAVTFTTTATLTATPGSLGGPATVAFTGAGDLTTGVALATAPAVVFTGTGDLSTGIAAAGTSAVVVTTTGDLGTLLGVAGSSAIVWTGSADLATGVGLDTFPPGSVSIVFTTTGTLDAQPRPVEEVTTGPNRFLVPLRQRAFVVPKRERTFKV